jgi:C-terminal processing protease CtpA/Prc
VQSPTIALPRIKCCVNVDMIGRLTNRRVEVYGSRSCTGLRQTISAANSTGLDLDFIWQMRDDSDHWPFFNQNIPVLMLHTGLHKDYHRPSDDAELINATGLEEVSRLMFQTTVALANADQLGKFRQESRRETDDVRRSAERAAAPPPARLGMTWKRQAVGDELALHVLTVNRDSAAEQAGLRIGDIVRRLDGIPIVDDGIFRRQVLAASKPLDLLVERPGEAERTATVNLHGAPIRIGLTTRQDPAEPGVVIVSHVVYGSPAAVAGVQIADRIDAVNGRAIASMADFNRELDEAKESLSLQIEHDGRLRQTTLQLIPR